MNGGKKKVFLVVRREKPFTIRENVVEFQKSRIIKKDNKKSALTVNYKLRDPIEVTENLEKKKSKIIKVVKNHSRIKNDEKENIIKFDPKTFQTSRIPSKARGFTLIKHTVSKPTHKPTSTLVGTKVAHSLSNKIARRGLFIGINYKNTQSELGGCINDSVRLRKFMVRSRYLRQNETLMMNDNQRGSLYPTKANILKQLDSLVQFAKNNRTKKVFIFVSYSGHGYYQRDYNGDEADGKDEVLCPIDCDRNGYIVDDLLRSRFVDKLPKNVSLVMLIDACHSGTVLDLRYSYEASGGSYSITDTVTNTVADVAMISGCKDNQTSADAYLQNPDKRRKEYQGAMTASFLSNYKNGISYDSLITNMRTWLIRHRFDQIPQLSTGKLVNSKTPFLLSSYRF